jgi:hypothetical protein
MINQFKTEILILLAFILVGQITFGIMSGRYTKPYFEGRLFATTGVHFDGKADLHTLTDAAHYFGQTMVGWTKFPNFRTDLLANAGLPEDAQINLHLQERQNIVLTLTSESPINQNHLLVSRDFLQSKLDEYNLNTNTKVILTNIDYDMSKIERSYAVGAGFALILSFVIGFGFLFLKKEFFPPKLKF